MRHYDYLIVGAGIIGLTIARELKIRFPDLKVCMAEKEEGVAKHASGRNSGVLHAGFYYPADSLKAKFTKVGNALLTRYCEENGLPVNKCGKVVVAAGEAELKSLAELKKRADRRYLKYEKNRTDISTNIYPVPDMNPPFLGVHCTKTVDGSIKIGPTAVPAFWRENYSGFRNFDWREFLAIVRNEARLFRSNAFHFRRLARDEIRGGKRFEAG